MLGPQSSFPPPSRPTTQLSPPSATSSPVTVPPFFPLPRCESIYQLKSVSVAALNGPPTDDEWWSYSLPSLPLSFAVLAPPSPLSNYSPGRRGSRSSPATRLRALIRSHNASHLVARWAVETETKERKLSRSICIRIFFPEVVASLKFLLKKLYIFSGKLKGNSINWNAANVAKCAQTTW